MPTCTKCGAAKDPSHFGQRAGRPQQHKSCRRCRTDAALDWKRKNPEKVAASFKKWSEAHLREYKARTVNRSLLRSAKCRAKKRGIPFSITLKDVVVPTHCPVLGLALVPHFGRGGGEPDSPSLDRIVPALGYVPGKRDGD